LAIAPTPFHGHQSLSRSRNRRASLGPEFRRDDDQAARESRTGAKRCLQKILPTLVPQLRCGTGSPEALLPRAVPQATARAVEAELQGTSAQARELGRQEKSHLTGCFSLVFAGDTSGTGDHMPTNAARGTNWCNSCAGQDHDVREASLV